MSSVPVKVPRGVTITAESRTRVAQWARRNPDAVAAFNKLSAGQRASILKARFSPGVSARGISKDVKAADVARREVVAARSQGRRNEAKVQQWLNSFLDLSDRDRRRPENRPEGMSPSVEREAWERYDRRMGRR